MCKGGGGGGDQQKMDWLNMVFSSGGLYSCLKLNLVLWNNLELLLSLICLMF